MKNTGPVTLNSVSVVDDNGTPADDSDDFEVDCPKTTLEAGESMSCEATLTVTTNRTNIAAASGESDGGTQVEDSDDAVVRVPAIGIEKSNDDADGVVGHGQTVHFTLQVSITNGPLTNAVITDTLPVGQTYAGGSQSSNPVASSFDISGDGRTLTWTYATLATGSASIDYDVTIDSNAETGDQTNVAEICVDELADCGDDDSTVRVPLLTIDKAVAGNSQGTDSTLGVPKAAIGDTLTYTLTCTLTNGPVTGGVITDVIPNGMTYIAASATDSAEYTFTSYDPATRTLRWDAPTVTSSSSVTYEVTVDVGAAALPQPLTNVATIDSNETEPDEDEQDIVVAPPPLEATATPRITLPPTSTVDTQDPSGNPGLALGFALLALVGLLAAVVHATPRAASARRREPRG